MCSFLIETWLGKEKLNGDFKANECLCSQIWMIKLLPLRLDLETSFPKIEKLQID